VWRWVELPCENPTDMYRRLPLERQGTIVLHSGWNPLPQGRFPIARFCFVATEPLAWLVSGRRAVRLAALERWSWRNCPCLALGGDAGAVANDAGAIGSHP